MKNRLYRSRYDRVVSGVCGGLGHYLGLDPVLIRILFVLLALADGVGVVIYFLMMIVVPENIEEAPPDETRGSGSANLAERVDAWSQEIGREGVGARNALFIGGFLILLGLLFLLRNFDVFLFRWFDLDTLWPLLIIAAGVAMLMRYYRRES